MECALCKNTILMEAQGFAQLPCKHTFHIRCMVPACDRFWGNGPVGCKICGSAPSNSLEPNAKPCKAGRFGETTTQK